ncbi:molybdenum cofactor guanylyltransferase [Bacillus sp. CRN 9]|nr:molybdenum cofactor guanylyltransferase [Bacillus sp. CRN 9]
MQSTGIILAGGKSSRMGRNKALMTLEDRAVIDRIADSLSTITTDLIVVTNTPDEFEFLGLRTVSDNYKEKGPLAGMEAGLRASNTEKNLIVACDMPFISSGIGGYLLTQLEEHEAAVPIIQNQLHPLFASYRKDVQSRIEQSIISDELKIRLLLEKINTKTVTETELKNQGFSVTENDFFNMNHPVDFSQALKISSQKSSES